MNLRTADGQDFELGQVLWLWSNSLGSYDCIMPVEVVGFTRKYDMTATTYQYRTLPKYGEGVPQEADAGLFFSKPEAIASEIKRRHFPNGATP